MKPDILICNSLNITSEHHISTKNLDILKIHIYCIISNMAHTYQVLQINKINAFMEQHPITNIIITRYFIKNLLFTNLMIKLFHLYLKDMPNYKKLKIMVILKMSYLHSNT